MSSIKRPAHLLRAEKTLAIPRHIIFFDCESKMIDESDGGVSHELKLGWACYLRRSSGDRREKQEWCEFTTAAIFWDFVFSRCLNKNKLWVIAHNLDFDFTVADGWKHLRAEGMHCKFFYSSGVTTLIKVKAKGRSIMFVDSLNWFKESLEKIGDRIGIPKLKIDFETADDSFLSTYCKRDVEVLVGIFKHLVRFLQANRISRLCYTIGSTAMAAFLFRHYRTKIYIHNNAQAIHLERMAYKGGRTECFYIGELDHGPYYCLDVNSLYPFVMREHLFPVKYKRICHHLHRSELRAYLRKSAVVAEVSLNTDDPAYAVRTVRTLFPVGRFTAVLCSPELRYALAHGHIESVTTAVIYQQANIFASYVDRFYELRREFNRADNSLFEHFCKILLNSLYGKFGQKAEQWKRIGDCPDEPDHTEDVIDATTHRRKKMRYLLGEVFEMTGHAEALHSFPAIAAHVTAYARMFLWRLMQCAGEKNYYYCDTDSLFVNETGLQNLSDHLHDTDLGKLKIESTTERLTIYGLKDYRTDNKEVIKGIRKTAIKISPIDYWQERWPTLRGMLSTGQTTTYKTAMQTKHLTRNYNKGVIDRDGWILPFYFDGFVETL